MNRLVATALLLAGFAQPLSAANAALAATRDGRLLIEASGTDERIRIREAESLRLLWTTEGSRTPAFIVTSPEEETAAIIDTSGDSVTLLSLRRKESQRITVRRPTAARFGDGSTLYVVSNAPAQLTRIGGGRVVTTGLPHDPAFVTVANGRLLVYCRVTGLLVDIDPSTLHVRRTATSPPFAADLESDGRHLYLVLPREGKIAVLDIETLAERERLSAGAVPTDVELQQRPGAMSAAVLAIADPSSKAIWRIEGTQSTGEAFARGFVRGLLGLGLYKPSSAAYPSGIDRLIRTGGGEMLAYDSSSETLYYRERIVARGVKACAIAAAKGSAYFVDGAGRLQRVPLASRRLPAR